MIDDPFLNFFFDEEVARAHIAMCQTHEYATSEGHRTFLQLVKMDETRWGVQKITYDQSEPEREMLYEDLSFVEGVKHLIDYDGFKYAEGELPLPPSNAQNKPHYREVLEPLGYAVSYEGKLAKIGPNGDILASGRFPGLLQKRPAQIQIENPDVTDLENRKEAEKFNLIPVDYSRRFKPGFIKSIGASKEVSPYLKGTATFSDYYGLFQRKDIETVQVIARRMGLSVTDCLKHLYQEFLTPETQNSLLKMTTFFAVELGQRELVREFIEAGSYHFEALPAMERQAQNKNGVSVLADDLGATILYLSTMPDMFGLLCHKLGDQKQNFFRLISCPISYYIKNTPVGATTETPYHMAVETLIEAGYPVDGFMENSKIPLVEAIRMETEPAKNIALILVKKGALSGRLNTESSGYGFSEVVALPDAGYRVRTNYVQQTRQNLVLKSLKRGFTDLAEMMLDENPQILTSVLVRDDFKYKALAPLVAKEDLTLMEGLLRTDNTDILKKYVDYVKDDMPSLGTVAALVEKSYLKSLNFLQEYLSDQEEFKSLLWRSLTSDLLTDPVSEILDHSENYLPLLQGEGHKAEKRLFASQLVEAVSNQQVRWRDAASLMVQLDLPKDSQNAEGRYLPHYACFDCDHEGVDYLRELGFKTNLRDSKGMSTDDYLTVRAKNRRLESKKSASSRHTPW